ncbi:MAG: hypothetical protein VZR00_03115 [Lachnospiraceae bacterium]|nr:hypothetical protein [Lachnospiraceae bacterium]MEE3460867.1 hypothetical protein [Lachnospiraceae bacterium]
MKKIYCIIMMAVVVFLIFSFKNSFAESVTVILHTNEKVVTSAALDNDGNGYSYTCGVLSTSKYRVRANYGIESHERTKGLVDPGHTEVWNISQTQFNYDKC